ALLAVDLGSGDRTVISNETTGAGPAFRTPWDVALDSANHRALVVDNSLDALLAVDLGSGERTVISNDTTGAGPVFTLLRRAVALDSANNRALVASTGIFAGEQQLIFAVDLGNGDRTVISNQISAFAFSVDLDVALDSANNRVLVVGWSTGDLKTLVAVDLDSGELTVISDATTGAGPEFVSPNAVALDSDNNRALVVDSGFGGLQALLAVDLDSGERTAISNPTTGAGPEFSSPNAFALDSDNNRALVVDGGFVGLQALLAVDLGSGERTVISNDTTGAGPAFSGPEGVALDGDNNRALVVDFSLDALLAVDLGSGERTVISNDTTGAGPAFSGPVNVALDSDNNRALVVDSEAVGVGALLAVDLGSGERTVISNDTTGAGPAFSNPEGVALDGDNNRALVLDTGLDALLAVDLPSGDRVIVSQ
ncbi:MAG: hypothetical protein GY807_15075, partial [Gammaproteobacteria bacterium]|nr:hypothetical protein [Gammaproteobacteria bacterium]